jgi:hypothetical protein
MKQRESNSAYITAETIIWNQSYHICNLINFSSGEEGARETFYGTFHFGQHRSIIQPALPKAKLKFNKLKET